MRLSSLVSVITTVFIATLVIATVLFLSDTALAQHSSGGGGGGGGASSGGGHSGGGFSGGAGSSRGSGGSSSSSSTSSSSRSSSSSSSSGRNSSSNAAGSARSSSGRSSSERLFPAPSLSGRSPEELRTGLNIRAELLHPADEKLDAQPEKKGFFSFLHHKKIETPVSNNPQFHCKKGEKCAPTCSSGRSWNGFGCAAQYNPNLWFSSCQILADELAQVRTNTRGNASQQLRYRQLRDAYQECLERHRVVPFAFSSLNELSLFGTP
jgi:hypothetical protein